MDGAMCAGPPKMVSELSGVLCDLSRRNEELDSVIGRLSRITQTLCGHSCKIEPDSDSKSGKVLVPGNILEDFRGKIEYQVDIIARIENLLARLDEVV